MNRSIPTAASHASSVRRARAAQALELARDAGRGVDPGHVGLQATMSHEIRSSGDTLLAIISHVHQQCPGIVVGDFHRLKQVLVNLLANAIEFTETGEVLLTVAPAEQDGGQRDDRAPTGGTAGDRQLVDTSTTRLSGGSGPGLAISKSLADAVGGTIRVDSAPPRRSGDCSTPNSASRSVQGPCGHRSPRSCGADR